MRKNVLSMAIWTGLCFLSTSHSQCFLSKWNASALLQTDLVRFSVTQVALNTAV